ncbi:hypothetical protein [Rhodocyclus purpureus]|uniref:hypothetical protein n=1 Tax=Rhodocyclus purpureus TaxID=1067 RepID=UPI001912E8BC|nr:hypothetical protein [Rhodocyclus purpureus]MBK5914277.1 hypothetical protein [Rhodocyclus purpureus]
MKPAQFRVTYDGPALASHQMDVRELAPALLAVGNALDAATRALYGDRIKAQTTVHASFKSGSFGIDFQLATDWVLKVRDIFASDTATAVVNAAELLGLLGLLTHKGRRGLMQVLKWLRGRAIERVEIEEGKVRLLVEGEAIEIEQAVLELLRDVAVREAIDAMLAPLDAEGVDIFASGDEDGFAVTVTNDERGWFHVPALTDELLLDDVRKMAFSIVSLAFKEDNKWRLYDGAATIHATITDQTFLARVDQNLVSFAKGDVLICMVRVQQWHSPSGARTEYEVVEVLEHRSAARQLRLPGT